MHSLKLIFSLYCVLIVSISSYAGEPGTDESKVEKNQAVLEKKKEIKKQEIQKEFVNTNINLPKNPIDKIFLQPFGKVIDLRYARITGNCLPAKRDLSCKVVIPKKKSSHFNQYYYYLNKKKAVYGVIAFSNNRVGTIDYCRSLIKEWNDYFKSFDFENKTKEDNLDQLILYTKALKPSEVYISCYPESYRDVKSYFSLKLFINED